MTKFLIASVAILGFAGVASAQQAPALYGSNYDASVLNGYSTMQGQSGSVVSGSASAVSTTDQGVASGAGFNINLDQNYSGK